MAMNAHQQAARFREYWDGDEAFRFRHEDEETQAREAYFAALASQSETLRALVEALREARGEFSSFVDRDLLAKIDAALSLAAELGVT